MDTPSIPAFMARKFKMIGIGGSRTIQVAYVKELSVEDKNSIQEILGKKISYKKQINDIEFLDFFMREYKDVSVNEIKSTSTEKHSTTTYSKPTYENVESVDIGDVLSKYTTEDLVTEIRKRHIKIVAKGTVVVPNQGQVQFEFDEMPWPSGAYKIEASIIEDITTEYIEKQNALKEGANNNE